MMYFYKIREVSPKEWHVIETRFEGEPEFILAKCSGPVPSSDIVNAMRIAQRIKITEHEIHNSIQGMGEALRIFKHESTTPTETSKDDSEKDKRERIVLDDAKNRVAKAIKFTKTKEPSNG